MGSELNFKLNDREHRSSRQEREAAYALAVGRRAEEQWGWATPAGQVRAERRAELVARAAGLGPGRRVLEVGCGNGHFTEKYARSGAEMVATDLSPGLIRLAVEKYPGPQTLYLPAAADRVPFPDQSFDAVVGNSILHHLELSTALPEFLRVLRTGAALALAEPNFLNPQMFLQRSFPWLRRLAGDSPDETAFVRFTLSRRLREAGFSRITLTPFDFLHPAVPPAQIPLISALGKLLEAIPLLRELAGSLLILAHRP
jgi:ubiquinone/menaquinone biosynthesis C-methylase UbiE